jgi:hypothetical protein
VESRCWHAERDRKMPTASMYRISTVVDALR